MTMPRRDFLAMAAALPVSMSLSGSTPAAEDQPFRVAVIGHTGRGNYGHGLDSMWKNLPGCEVVAVADANAKGLANAQKSLGVSKGFADYRAMLSEVRPDIVSIAPRFIDEHRDMAIAAAEAGARGIYMEKPYCRTPLEADELKAAFAKHNVKCALAHRNRYHPALAQVQKLIQEGGIGKVLEIRTRGKEDHRGGGADLWVLGSHTLNLAGLFAGAPTAVSATMLNNGVPATPADRVQAGDAVGWVAGNEMHVRYETASGIPVFFDSIAKAGTNDANFGLQLIGTKGIIDIRIDLENFANVMFGCPTLATREPRVWTPITSAGVGQPEPDTKLHSKLAGHVLAGLDLLDAIRTGREPLCNAEEGATSVEMICGAFASHVAGGARVALPLVKRTHPLDDWTA